MIKIQANVGGLLRISPQCELCLRFLSTHASVFQCCVSILVNVSLGVMSKIQAIKFCSEITESNKNKKS